MPFFQPSVLKKYIKYPRSIIATYSDELFLFNRSNIAVVPKANSEYSLKFILAILNSKLISYYFIKNTPKAVRQMFPKVILQDLRLFPIRSADNLIQKPFVEQVEKMLLLNSNQLDVIKVFKKFLKTKISAIEISKKLSSWHLLTSKEFLKELEKQKIKLSLSEQNQWLQYFESEKKKANELQEVIDRTDKEIDTMVYELYELTEEEIRIVEGS